MRCLFETGAQSVRTHARRYGYSWPIELRCPTGAPVSVLEYRLRPTHICRADRRTYHGLRANYSAAARNPGKDRTRVGRTSRVEVGIHAGGFRRTIYPVAAGPSVAGSAHDHCRGARYRRLRAAQATPIRHSSNRHGYSPPMSMFSPIAQPIPSPNGCEHIPVPRSSAATAPAPMPKLPVPERRMRSKSPTDGTCGTTSLNLWRKPLQPIIIA